MADLQPRPLETITVEHPDNPGEQMIINKSDFDPAIHKPYEPPAPEPVKPESGQQSGAGENPNALKQEGGGKEGSKSKNKPEK